MVDFVINLRCGTLSKALEKSRRIMSVCFLLSMDLAMSLMVMISWVSQDLLRRKPCCVSVRILCFSMWVMMLLVTMCSSNLQVMEVSETGR